MNYTRPNIDNHEDKPSDWLNSALIFARAMSMLLKDKEGIVVDLHGDMKFEKAKKVMVYKLDHQIHIQEAENDLSEGQMVWVD